MKNLFQVLFSLDNLMITLATIGVILLLRYIPQNVDFLDPVGAALGDVELTDMVFSQFRNEDRYGVDTNIVIVNIGFSDREQIAEMIDQLNVYDPKVIGIDAFFRDEKDPEIDEMLASAMSDVENLVLVSKVAFAEESRDVDATRFDVSDVSDDREFDTLELSHPTFTQHATTGFANLITEQEAAVMTCRKVSLIETWSGQREPSFAVRIAEIYNPQAASKADELGPGEQTINYRGNTDKFFFLDGYQVLDPELDLSFIEGKIVLMGFCEMSESMDENSLAPNSLEDVFFTPMNSQYVGRSFPDCYGVVIHANVISMILRGEYMEAMADSTSIIIGLIVLVVNVMLFTYMFENHEDWYDVFAITVALIESIAIMFLVVIVFDKLDYKLNLTPALLSVFLVGTVHDLYQDSLKPLAITGYEKLRARGSS